MENNPLSLFITKLPEILMAISVILAAYWSYKAKEQGKANSKQIVEQGNKQAAAIEVVRNDVNDKMQQFIQVTGESEHAKGVIQGEANRQPILAADEVVKVQLVEESTGEITEAVASAPVKRDEG